ncbi:MAG: redoxin family protein [Terriglobales bacterium]
MAFIAAEKREGVWKPAKFLEKHPIASVFLLDEDRAVTRECGLYHAFARDALNIAHPATLLIDGNRVVRYIYRGDNQHDRAPLDEVLKVFREIH